MKDFYVTVSSSTSYKTISVGNIINSSLISVKAFDTTTGKDETKRITLDTATGEYYVEISGEKVYLDITAYDNNGNVVEGVFVDGRAAKSGSNLVLKLAGSYNNKDFEIEVTGININRLIVTPSTSTLYAKQGVGKAPNEKLVAFKYFDAQSEKDVTVYLKYDAEKDQFYFVYAGGRNIYMDMVLKANGAEVEGVIANGLCAIVGKYSVTISFTVDGEAFESTFNFEIN